MQTSDLWPAHVAAPSQQASAQADRGSEVPTSIASRRVRLIAAPRSTRSSRRRTSGPPFKSSTPFCTTRNKSRPSCENRSVADSFGASLTSRWQRSATERPLSCKSAACMRLFRRSTSSFLVSVSRRSLPRSGKRYSRRRRVVIDSCARRSSASAPRTRMPSVKRSIWSTGSRRKWKWSASSRWKSDARRKSTSRKCSERTRPIRCQPTTRGKLKSRRMCRRNLNTVKCLISKRRIVCASSVLAKPAPKTS